MCKKQTFKIIVSDLNHHIRDLLHRELEEDGYDVSSISNGIEVCNSINIMPHCADLIIVDPALFYPYGNSLFTKIRKKGRIRIIIHTFESIPASSIEQEDVYFVEKNGSSVAKIKEIARSCSLAKNRDNA